MGTMLTLLKMSESKLSCSSCVVVVYFCCLLLLLFTFVVVCIVLVRTYTGG